MTVESLPAGHLWIQSETQTICQCQVLLESKKASLEHLQG